MRSNPADNRAARRRSRRARFIGAGMAATIGLLGLVPSAASAAPAATKAKPTLAEILLSDSKKDGPGGFDHNANDYDIVTQALLLYPDLVATASDPNAKLTAFLPTDFAFRRLVHDITGKWVSSEADVFKAVASLGTDTVKQVLQYHIVPGAAVPYSAALKANGASLDTALPGAKITVKVTKKWPKVTLVDADTNDRDPRVIRPNLGGEAANGYAHGINRVLRPVDLP